MALRDGLLRQRRAVGGDEDALVHGRSPVVMPRSLGGRPRRVLDPGQVARRAAAASLARMQAAACLAPARRRRRRSILRRTRRGWRCWTTRPNGAAFGRALDADPPRAAGSRTSRSRACTARPARSRSRQALARRARRRSRSRSTAPPARAHRLVGRGRQALALVRGRAAAAGYRLRAGRRHCSAARGAARGAGWRCGAGWSRASA